MGLFVWNSMNSQTGALTQKGFPPYGRGLVYRFLPPFPLPSLESTYIEQTENIPGNPYFGK